MTYFKSLTYSFFLSLVILLLSACTQQIQDHADEKALEAKQKEASVLNAQLGLNYLNQGNPVLAKEKLLLALDKDPNSFVANSAMAYYDEMTGHIIEAEKLYLKALKLSEIKGAAQNNYAIFLCRQKRYDAAQKYFDLAVNDLQYVNTAKAYENAGLCARRIPDDKKAIIYFKKALQNDPNLKISMIELAKIYKEQGQYQKAYDYLKTEMLLDSRPSTENLLFALFLAQKVGDQNGMILYKAQLQKAQARKASIKE